MKSEPKVDNADTLAPGRAVPESSSRRRLLRAGVGASPVLLSVISQPVRAGFTSTSCRSASAFASVNANANPVASANAASACAGNGPVTWKGTNPAIMPAAKDNLFCSGSNSYAVYQPSGQANVQPTYISSPTLYQVLQYGVYNGTARDRLALCIAAAKLNLASSTMLPSAVATQSSLNAMWAAAQGGGTYSVNSGVNWNATQIADWLTTTFVNN